MHFLKSIYCGKSSTAFFPYPKYTKCPSKTSERLKQYNREDLERLHMAFKISESAHIYNAVVNSFKNAGFALVEKGEYWNVMWAYYTKVDEVSSLNKYQKINHFPGSVQLGRKDLLWYNMQRQLYNHPKDYNITPVHYVFPEDYLLFQADKDREKEDTFYILKPVASSCGRGIKVINAKTKIPNRTGYLASKYIANPHLINSYKYDLRVYVLVTTFSPLRVYMY